MIFTRLRSLSVFPLFFFLFCSNPTDEDGCGSPTIHSCSGSQCIYTHIYDAYGNFIAETGSPGMGYVMWDGKDCHGITVPCGKYIVEHHVVSGGFEQTVREETLLKDSTAVTKYGRPACDSLRSVCSEGYAEAYGSYIDDENNLHSNDLYCICCE